MFSQYERSISFIKEDIMNSDHAFSFIPFGSYPLVSFGTSNAY